MNSNEWVPSHVQVTVNQARELLLKNKHSSSEVFVIVNTDKEKFVTTSVLRCIDPVWNFTSEIPLMSLDTTLHLTVRQTGRLSDEFIGYIAIPLSGFKLSSKQVTHWYKLGSRPGKQNHKLRGDLQITIQLLFNWVQQFSEPVTITPSSKKIYPLTGKGSIKRTKPDFKTVPQERSSSLPNESEIPLTERTSQPQSKVKEKMSVFRRSFRKKNRSPVFQECVDDFTSFSSPTLPRARSNTIDISSRPSEVPKKSSGASLSDISSSESSDGAQTPLKPNVLEIFPEAMVLEEEERDQGKTETKDVANKETDVKMSPAARYYSFRTKKKRWTMQDLPLSTQSPAHTPTDHAITPDSLEEDTYVAKPAHSPMISRSRAQSLYIDDARQSINSLSSPAVYGSAGDVNTDSTDGQGKREPESGYSTSSSLHKVRQMAVNDETKEAPKREEKKVTKTLSSGTKLLSKPGSPPSKRTVTSPTSRTRPRPQSRQGAVSPSNNKQKTRGLSVSSGTNSLKRETRTRNISGSRSTGSVLSPNRSPALSRTPSGNSRPVAKVSRSASLREQGPIKRRPKSMIEVGKAREKPVKPADGRKKEKKLESGQDNGVASSTEVANDSSTSSSSSVETVVVNVPVKDDTQEETVNEPESVSVEQQAVNSQTSQPPECSSNDLEPSQVLPEGQQSGEAVPQVDIQVATDPTEQAEPVPRSESSSPNDESVSVESDTSSVTTADDRRPKHTVVYNEKSPLFKDGFQPVSLLPPSLMSYQSQTLPTQGKLTRHSSDGNFAIQRPSTVSNSQELHRQSVTLRQSSQTENTCVLHRRSMNITLLSTYHQVDLDSIPQSPPIEINSLEDLNREESDSRKSTASTISQGSESRPSTPSTPTSVKYGGKTPGEIVTSALRNRKPTGGLRNAITRYQESRKQRRESLRGTYKEQSELQVEEECLDRSTSSAESSPSLRRHKSAASAFSNVIRSPFNSLRRTKSHSSTSNGRPASIADSDSTDLGSLSDLQPPTLKVPANSLTSIDRSESLERLSLSSPQDDDVKTLVESSIKSDVSTRSVREDTPTLTESASVKTLTEAECPHMSVRRTSSPNPAGAVTGTHVRHTTCSSIGSEGIGSLTSEELSLDDLTHQDWSHWSKEDLVKELIHSKQRLKTTEEELKDVKNYLDNLLLRIMETNPSLLSAVRTS